MAAGAGAGIRFKVTVDDSQVQRALGERRDRIRRTYTDPVRKAADDGKTYLQKYPPPRNLKRPRTGTLGRGWKYTTEVRGDEAEVKLTNPVPYSPYVQDDERQRPYHRQTGWRTTGQAARRIEQRYRTHMRKVVTDAAR